MNRYEIEHTMYLGESMVQSLDGDYVLYSDLIAAGCLVPVPVGEPVNIRAVGNGPFTCDHPGIWHCVWASSGLGQYVIVSGTGERAGLLSSAIVQPVKLLTLAELEADHG